MMKSDESRFSSIEQGQAGEMLAGRYLSKQGYKILEKNWKIRGGEIDLIVQKKEVITFVEVKLRRSSSYGSGMDAIHPAKQKKMVRAALFYLQKKSLENREIRFAALSIHESQNESSIEFIEFPLDLRTRYY